MKIRIEFDEKIKEDEVVIRCRELNNQIKKVKEVLSSTLSEEPQITFYKDSTEYYISLEDILFFETEESSISAHTLDNVYQVKYKLYELEEILPREFVRAAKSTIVNINHIYSMTRNFSSSSLVEFKHTHKEIYVSRHYYKDLKNKLMEKRR